MAEVVERGERGEERGDDEDNIDIITISGRSAVERRGVNYSTYILLE